MSFAFWPAAETVERFNQQVLRRGTPPRRIGIAWLGPVASKKAGVVPPEENRAQLSPGFQTYIRGFLFVINL